MKSRPPATSAAANSRARVHLILANLSLHLLRTRPNLDHDATLEAIARTITHLATAERHLRYPDGGTS